MSQRVGCIVVLKDGTRISCDRITKNSITLYGTTEGDIEVLVGDEHRTIILDDIAQIVRAGGAVA